MVDTNRVKNRRKVKYTGLAEILADAERLAGGEIETLGNWSAGQVFSHLGETTGLSIDGFGDAKMPTPLAVMGRVLRPMFLRMAPPAGVKPPAELVALFKAPESVSTDDGLAILREQTERAALPGAMNAVSPLVGKLGPREWTMFHCRHAELHMSFLRPAGG